MRSNLVLMNDSTPYRLFKNEKRWLKIKFTLMQKYVLSNQQMISALVFKMWSGATADELAELSS